MTDFRHETKMALNGDGSLRLQWIAHGEHGSVEFWAELYPFSRTVHVDNITKAVPYFVGGVEMHSRKPFDHSRLQDTPDNAECSVLGAPCWHDGSGMAGERCMADYVRGGAWDALWAYLDDWVRRHDEKYAGEAT